MLAWYTKTCRRHVPSTIFMGSIWDVAHHMFVVFHVDLGHRNTCAQQTGLPGTPTFTSTGVTMWTQICVLAVSRGRWAENGGQLGEAKASQNEDSAWEVFRMYTFTHGLSGEV